MPTLRAFRSMTGTKSSGRAYALSAGLACRYMNVWMRRVPPASLVARCCDDRHSKTVKPKLLGP